MEFSLHRQLKERYADGDQTEVRHGSYRVDAIAGDELIEIQHSRLSAIRGKVERLLAEHKVRVVKPLVTAKRLIKRARKGGKVVDRRWSPKRGTLLDSFDELVSFARLIPHRRLIVEIVPVVIEEWRRPGHGKRRRWRASDFIIEDRILSESSESVEIRRPRDLLTLLPQQPPATFDTAILAETLGVARWTAQRIAYCLRESGAAKQIGKKGNSLIYSLAKRRRRAAA